MTGETEAGLAGTQATRNIRRDKWTEQQRRRIVAESRVAGASIQEVAQRHGVRPNLLSSWRGQGAKPKVAEKAQFAAVRVSANDGSSDMVPVSASPSSRDRIQIRRSATLTKQAAYPTPGRGQARNGPSAD
jgi:transposase-like protein